MEVLYSELMKGFKDNPYFEKIVPFGGKVHNEFVGIGAVPSGSLHFPTTVCYDGMK